MRVAICDDEDMQLSITKKNLENAYKSLDLIVDTYTSGVDLLNAVNVVCYDLIILDMSCQWNFAWNDNETIQAYEAWEQNRRLRKIEKDYIVPFEEMLKALCGIE